MSAFVWTYKTNPNSNRCQWKVVPKLFECYSQYLPRRHKERNKAWNQHTCEERWTSVCSEWSHSSREILQMLLLPERSVAEPCLLQHRMHVVLPEGNITHKHILRCSHRTHQCLVLVSSNSKMENNYGAGHQAIFYSLNYFLTRSAPTFAYHCIIIRPANYILFS